MRAVAQSRPGLLIQSSVVLRCSRRLCWMIERAFKLTKVA